MKLKTILAISMALALPPAITAQDEERNFMGAAFGIHEFGVDLHAIAGYPNGTAIFILGMHKFEENEGIPLPPALGGGEVSVLPWGEPILTPTDAIGGHHLQLQFYTDVLAYLRAKVYVQVLSLNSPDWPDVPIEPNESGGLPPVRVSNVLTMDFYQAWLNRQIVDPAPVLVSGGGSGAEAPDGDNGTEPDTDSRDETGDQDANGRSRTVIR